MTADQQKGLFRMMLLHIKGGIDIPELVWREQIKPHVPDWLRDAWGTNYLDEVAVHLLWQAIQREGPFAA